MSTTNKGANPNQTEDKENNPGPDSKSETKSISLKASKISFSGNTPSNLKQDGLHSESQISGASAKNLSFSEIYKTSSLLKSSTSDFIKNEDTFQSSNANDVAKNEVDPGSLQGLSLDWCLGLNTACLNNIQNLTTETQSTIFYTSGNTGVLYDYNAKTQLLFQGHTDSISSVCYNPELDILVTADCGESCLMVVWRAGEGVPLKTFFEPHENGVAVIDISPCGKWVGGHLTEVIC